MFLRLHPKTVTAVLTAVLTGVFILTACSSKTPDSANEPPPIEVGVVKITAASTAINSELPGRTVAFRLAEVRPQVSGIIEKRFFTEGTEIKAGTQLYQIDAATYQAAYSTAKAELARAEANVFAAKAREKRYKNLLASKAVSQQDYDDALAAMQQADASLAAGKASVETANINLKYTKVIAPISGIIGKSSVTEGALVTAGQANVLATIQQLDPIYVDVSQSADEMLQLRRQIMSGKMSNEKTAKVKLLLNDGSTYKEDGTLQFTGVGVSESTGTVVLRALFPNPDRLLLPGMFVRTQLEEGIRGDAILAPQQGVTRDRSGNATALVVNAENKVEARKVITSRAIGDKWLVEDGLAVGDQLIVEGLQKIKPGATVKAVPAKIANESGE